MLKWEKSCALLLLMVFWSHVVQAQKQPGELSLRVDLTRERAVRVGSMEKSSLDRKKYFRCYHFPGMFSEERVADLKAIGAIPARGTGPYYDDPAGDTGRQCFDLDIEKQNWNYARMYQRAALRYPGWPHAIAGNRYPKVDRLPEAEQAIAPERFEAAADSIVEFFTTIKAAGGSAPSYFTTFNEPFWRAAGEEAREQFYAFVRVLSERMERVHPEVQISGPCTAWFWPEADWNVWENGWEKSYIETVGDRVDAYDLHPYSKGYWAWTENSRGVFDPAKQQDEPSLYEGQFNGNHHIWDFGRLNGYLDLFAAHHLRNWGGGEPRPVIISEFGRQSLYPQMGPWENDFRYFMYMTLVTRFWMTFMERPEVRLTVPFILAESDAGYSPLRGQAIYTRPGAPEDMRLVRTPFHAFYAFFRELKGRRVPLAMRAGGTGDARYLSRAAYLNDSTLYVLLHNGKGYPRHPLKISLGMIAGTDSDGQPLRLVAQGIKRLRWEGPVPARVGVANPEGRLRIDGEDEYEPLDDLDGLILQGEETAIIKLDLSGVPAIGHRVTELVSYSTSTVQDISGKGPHEVEVTVPQWQGEMVRAWLVLGLAREGGFSVNPNLRVNGRNVGEVDLGFSKGIAAFHGPVRVPLPPECVQFGVNRVSVQFPEPVREGWPKLVTAKMVVAWENLVAGEDSRYVGE